MSHPKSASEMLLEGHPNASAIKSNPLATGIPERPIGLGLHGNKLWDEHVPTLCKLGLATSIDAPMLASMCRWWNYHIEGDADYRKLRRDERSTIIGRRAFQNLQESFKQYSLIANQFGMTPKSRAAVSIEQPGDDELDDIM